MKSKKLFFLAIVALFFSCTKKDESFIFRNIGHTLLLQSGDSTSRVLPIKNLGDNTFLIEFESDFQLNPDTLINIVERHLAHHSAKNEYRVSVLGCLEKTIVYGYEVSKRNDFSIPCTGRVYPKACYKIQIQLLETTLPWKTICGITLSLMLAIGYLLLRKKQTKSIENQDFILVGAIKFYPKNQTLVFENGPIALSAKETKLLLLLSEKPNKIIDRDLLLKEVWENDGVFVISRNLDVLVSKLRKKLVADPAVKITNSHGKGYKLEV
jgi:DNA-binding winged helix-turn-helix (wHTH) protein